MTLKSDLRDVTDNIKVFRNLLAKAEVERLKARANAANAEANLDHTRTYLMAQPEAGTNDNQRRAYAQAKLVETGLSLDATKTAEAALAAEMAVIAHAAALRVAEDERRCLEFLARLAIAGATETANAFASANGHSEEEFAL